MADKIEYNGFKSINSESEQELNNTNTADKCWQEFLNTGTVAAYLNYKLGINNS